MKALVGPAITLYQRRNGRSGITSNKKRKRRIVFRKQVYSYSNTFIYQHITVRSMKISHNTYKLLVLY